MLKTQAEDIRNVITAVTDAVCGPSGEYWTARIQRLFAKPACEVNQLNLLHPNGSVLVDSVDQNRHQHVLLQAIEAAPDFDISRDVRLALVSWANFLERQKRYDVYSFGTTCLSKYVTDPLYKAVDSARDNRLQHCPLAAAVSYILENRGSFCHGPGQAVYAIYGETLLMGRATHYQAARFVRLEPNEAGARTEVEFVTLPAIHPLQSHERLLFTRGE